MSAAGRSLFVFGIYLLVLGIVVILVPNWLLGILGVPPTTDVWIRVVGVLVLVIGFYDLRAGRNGLNEFFSGRSLQDPQSSCSFLHLFY